MAIHPHIERLRLRSKIAEAMVDLQADPTNEVKKVRLAALIDEAEARKQSLSHAITKALLTGNQSGAVARAPGALQKRLQLRADIEKAEEADVQKVKAKAADLRKGQDNSGFGITERVRKRAGRPGV